jgi:hypothetical protein
VGDTGEVPHSLDVSHYQRPGGYHRPGRGDGGGNHAGGTQRAVLFSDSDEEDTGKEFYLSSALDHPQDGGDSFALSPSPDGGESAQDADTVARHSDGRDHRHIDSSGWAPEDAAQGGGAAEPSLPPDVLAFKKAMQGALTFALNSCYTKVQFGSYFYHTQHVGCLTARSLAGANHWLMQGGAGR